MTESCSICGGTGYVFIPTTTHGCCGNFFKNNECCGNAVQVDSEPDWQPCPECNGTGKVSE